MPTPLTYTLHSPPLVFVSAGQTSTGTFFASDGSTLYRSDDALTWVDAGVGFAVNTLSCSGTRIVTRDGAGVCRRSSDSGITWTPFTPPANTLDVAVSSNGTIAALVGPAFGAGSVTAYQSTDGGSTWAASPLVGTSGADNLFLRCMDDAFFAAYDDTVFRAAPSFGWASHTVTGVRGNWARSGLPWFVAADGSAIFFLPGDPTAYAGQGPSGFATMVTEVYRMNGAYLGFRAFVEYAVADAPEALPGAVFSVADTYDNRFAADDSRIVSQSGTYTSELIPFWTSFQQAAEVL